MGDESRRVHLLFMQGGKHGRVCMRETGCVSPRGGGL